MPQGIRRSTKRLKLRELAEANGWTNIGESEWAVIIAHVPNVRTEDLRAAGLSATAPWGGIAQHTLEELEASLLAMSSVYQKNPDLQKFCRNEVIKAKDLARIISRTKPGKTEMVEWMLVWLSDPRLFPVWIEVRKKLIATH